jgi:peptide/nickel transport system ATP-binding protein
LLHTLNAFLHPSITIKQMNSAAQPLVEVDRLRIRFNAQAEAVSGISFSIQSGEVLGLVGESGSGKSATSLALLDLLPPTAQVEGSLRWQGSEVPFYSPAQRKMRGRKIAMIFQEPMTALNPVMTIGRQIAEAAFVSDASLTRREVRTRVLDALHSVALPEPERRFSDYPHQFSGGQLQRILIAMALINRPQLLIADEPTTALDVTVQAQVLALLKNLQQEYGLAMLFISHDLAVVGQVASRVAVLRHGQIVEAGSTAQILTAPAHEYTRTLLAAVPTLRTDRTKPLAQIVNHAPS